MTLERELERRYLNRPEAAAYLGISIRQFDGWVAEKLIPVVRPGRRVVVDKRDLDQFYKSLKQPAV